MAAATGALPAGAARFRDEPHVGVVLAARGYPDSPETGQRDRRARRGGGGARRAGVSCRHRRRATAPIVTAGGRVLTVVGRGRVVSATRSTTPTRPSRHVRFDGMQFRTDIGRKALAADCRHEVRGRHLRLPRQPGRLARDRRRAARRAARRASPATQADVVVVNTCSVTAAADQGARQTIRRWRATIPSARIVVTGCYATRRPDELAALPNVVRVVPNPDKDRVADVLCPGPGAWASSLTPPRPSDTPASRRPVRSAGWRRASAGARRSRCACRPAATSAAATASSRAHAARAARSRSTGCGRPSHDAVAAGYREIALCGVHLGSYGRDLAERLVAGRRSCACWADWPADVLFRVSSLEPMDCTAELVRLVAASPRLAPHFHLPLQHGDDAMLRAMRRPYTRRRTTNGWSTGIAAAMPHASIGIRRHRRVSRARPTRRPTRSPTLLERLPLSHLHVFPYSDRPGTEASGLPDKIDGRDHPGARRAPARDRRSAVRALPRIADRHACAVRSSSTTARRS